MFGRNSGMGVSNSPVWNAEVLRPGVESEVMTINGTIQKTGLLLIIAILTGAFAWSQTLSGSSIPYQWIGLGVGLVIALIISFKPNKAPALAPVYAGFEGLFLGSISAWASLRYTGIASQAFFATMGTLAVMLALYHTRVIRVNDKFRAIMGVLIGAVCLLYLSTWVLGFFGVNMGFMVGSGLLSIGITVVIIGIAAFSLLMDFDMIERGSMSGAPKYMEWYGAFALMVTLVWLYIEFLKLFLKLQGRGRD